MTCSENSAANQRLSAPATLTVRPQLKADNPIFRTFRIFLNDLTNPPAQPQLPVCPTTTTDKMAGKDAAKGKKGTDMK